VAVLTLGGTIQLIPQLRRHALKWHTWNGRLFMITAMLAVLELYLRTRKRGETTAHYSVAALLFALSLLTAVGIFGAYKVFWAPLF